MWDELQASRKGEAVRGIVARVSGGRVTGLLALVAGCRDTVELRATETVGDREWLISSVLALLEHHRTVELAR
jgi:hypothetical protein